MEEGAQCSIKRFLNNSSLANHQAASKHCQAPDRQREGNPYHENTQ